MMWDAKYKMNFFKEMYGIEYKISVFNFFDEFRARKFDGEIIIKYLRYSYKWGFSTFICIPYEKRDKYQKFLLSWDEDDIPEGPWYPPKKNVIVTVTKKS